MNLLLLFCLGIYTLLLSPTTKPTVGKSGREGGSSVEGRTQSPQRAKSPPNFPKEGGNSGGGAVAPGRSGPATTRSHPAGGVGGRAINSPEGALITGIELKGLNRLDERVVRRWIFIQEGDSFSRRALEADLRRLRRSGYFSRVEATVRSDGKLAIVTFHFRERRGIIQRIYFLGSTLFSPQQLKAQISTREGMPLDRKAIISDTRKLVRLYYSMGYFRVQIEVKGAWRGEALSLWFIIREGEPAKIRHVQLSGNRREPTEALLKLLNSRPAGVGNLLLGMGYYHPSFVARDIYFLQNYYYDRGYLQVKISRPKLLLSRNRHGVILHYHIFEGPVYRYGKIQIDGDLILPREKLRKLLTIREGEIFNRTKLYRENILKLTELYQNAGYAYAQIRVIPQVDIFRKRVSLLFQISKGPKVYVERIEIAGNKETSDRVIRDKIALREGELYSQLKLRQSVWNIFSTGYFHREEGELPIKLEKRPGSRPDRMVLKFQVREKSTWLYNIGFNYLPLIQFVVVGQLGKRNLFGKGQTLLGGGLLSTSMRLWQFFVLFVEPSLWGSQLWFSTNLSVSHRDLSSSSASGFVRDAYGITANFSYPILDSLRLGLNYRLERVEITPSGNREFNVPIAGYFGSRTFSGFSLQLDWDMSNRIYVHNWGWRIYGNYDQAAPYFGADFTLHRWEVGLRLYTKLPFWKSLFKMAVTVGFAYSPDVWGIPPFERYPFDGSFFLLRGYEPNSLGPVRYVPSRGEGTFVLVPFNWGGNKKFIANVEWIIPLIRSVNLDFFVFFDAGNAFDEREGFFFSSSFPELPLGLFYNVGFGFRWNLPNLGVVRFEWGIPLTPRRGDPAVLFGFRVGESF